MIGQSFVPRAQNGEINCLDPGSFGAVTITKSITIDCNEVVRVNSQQGTNGVNIPFDSFNASMRERPSGWAISTSMARNGCERDHNNRRSNHRRRRSHYRRLADRRQFRRGGAARHLR
jgi:hypothetical protein